MSAAATRPLAATGRGFSLIELLAVMGILVLLAVLTAVGVGRISKEARVSTAVNRISAALANARAIAIRENTHVLVLFRVEWPVNASGAPANRAARQVTELVVTRFSGESYVPNPSLISDRFVPVPGVPPVRLPAGIKVAGPNYEFESGSFETQAFYTQPEFRLLVDGCNEYLEYGRHIGILFGPDGRRVNRRLNATARDQKISVDLNGNGVEDVDFTFQGGCGPSNTFGRFYFLNHPSDETNVMLVPFLVVYDDDAARELKTGDWRTRAGIEAELVGRQGGYIASFGERIDFNPVTGVVQR